MAELFSNFTESLSQVSFRRVFEHTGRRVPDQDLPGLYWASDLRRICSLVIARRSFYVLNFVSQGLLFTSLYLKQCAVHLQQYYAGSAVIVGSSAVNVSLSRAGIPTIIPKRHRFIIMSRSERGDRLVRVSLSWFSVCRILPLAKRVSKATFSSITTPLQTYPKVMEVMGKMEEGFKAISQLDFPWISEIPLSKGISWKPTWKTLPNDDRRYWKVPKPEPNVFSSLKYELAAFALMARLFKGKYEAWHPGMLW